MTVFELFSETKYEFLEIERGTVYGNRIVSVVGEFDGVFREKSGMRRGSNGEVFAESSKLYAKPNDLPENIVGCGVRVSGKVYEITSVVEGKNFDSGEVEHLVLTLERTEFNEC